MIIFIMYKCMHRGLKMLEEFIKILPDVLLEGFVDSVKTVPFLFAAYLLLELIEHKSASKLSNVLLSGKFGIPGGALLGCIPQCGMGVATSHLFSAGTVTAGTLIAVFISTSDEAVPVLLSHSDKIHLILPLLLVKVTMAVVAGYLFSLLFGKKKSPVKHEHNSHSECHDCEEIKHCHDHHCDEKCDGNVLTAALKRTVEVFLYVLVLNIVFTLIIALLGEDKIYGFLDGARWLQPALAALVGLIPNCAASVAVTTLYMEEAISFGAAAAGLSTGAGLGYLALFKSNKNIKENILLLGYIFVFSTLCGMLIQLAGI